MQQENKVETYLNSDKKYLVKINHNYYFCFRHKKRIIKYSLKTKDLYTANNLKLEIIQRLNQNKEINMKFDVDEYLKEAHIERKRPYTEFADESGKVTYTDKKTGKPYGFPMMVNVTATKGESPEQVKRIEDKILRLLIREREKENIKDIEFLSENVENITIEDGFNNFLADKIDEVGVSSIKSYKGFYKYLLFFVEKDFKIHAFNEKFFKEMHTKMKVIPRNIHQLKKYKDKKYDDIMKDFEGTDYDKLSNKTLNNIFSFYKNTLFPKFIYKDYIKVNPVMFESLKETTNSWIPMTSVEIQILFNRTEDERMKIFYKIALYTGLRIDEIYSLKHRNFDFENNCINLTRDCTKTDSGVRVIPIHKEILNQVIQFYEYSKDEGYELVLGFDETYNAVSKRLNGQIRKYMKNPQKVFHSLRKNFTQKLYQMQQLNIVNQPSEVIERLLGHKINSLTFDIYNMNKVELIPLRDFIDNLEYDFL